MTEQSTINASHAREQHSEHDHGSAPGFLPHWMQENWSLLLIGMAGVAFGVAFIGETFAGLPHNIALSLYILAYIAGGYDIATHAIPGLFRGEFDTDILMLAAAAGAAILGEWAEGAFLLFLFGLGHAGEHYAVDRARNAVSELGALMPSTARVREGDDVREKPVEALELDDIVVVRPGDRLPADGEIVNGRSAIDQSAITGESVPVERGEGDEVFAGTVNGDTTLDVRVTRLAADNTLSRVIRMVEEAQEQRSDTQRLTQRFTAWFVPGALLLAAAVMLIPPLLNISTWGDSFYRGVLLLVAASPCALAIGTPAAVLSGIAQGARHGVLIKGGVHLENLGSLNTVAFDKTGTITHGTFKVRDVMTLGDASEADVLRAAAAVESGSSHPLGAAIIDETESRQIDYNAAGDVENINGKGLMGTADGIEIQVGARRLFDALPDNVTKAVEHAEANGATTVIVQQDGTFLGVIALADTARDGVGEVLARLKAAGVEHLVMLTGDNATVAQNIADGLGLTDVRAGLMPQDKLNAVEELEAQYGSIAMIGDGVNDAPALATATVGIAMGGAGTAVALESADVALMADDLSKLPFAIGLGRATRRIIYQNLAIALGVIAILMLTSVFGLVKLSGAVVLHEGSTLIVVANALRLLRYKDTAAKNATPASTS